MKVHIKEDTMKKLSFTKIFIVLTLIVGVFSGIAVLLPNNASYDSPAVNQSVTRTTSKSEILKATGSLQERIESDANSAAAVTGDIGEAVLNDRYQGVQRDIMLQAFADGNKYSTDTSKSYKDYNTLWPMAIASRESGGHANSGSIKLPIAFIYVKDIENAGQAVTLSTYKDFTIADAIEYGFAASPNNDLGPCQMDESQRTGYYYTYSDSDYHPKSERVNYETKFGTKNKVAKCPDSVYSSIYAGNDATERQSGLDRFNWNHICNMMSATAKRALDDAQRYCNFTPQTTEGALCILGMYHNYGQAIVHSSDTKVHYTYPVGEYRKIFKAIDSNADFRNYIKEQAIARAQSAIDSGGNLDPQCGNTLGAALFEHAKSQGWLNGCTIVLSGTAKTKATYGIGVVYAYYYLQAIYSGM